MASTALVVASRCRVGGTPTLLAPAIEAHLETCRTGKALNDVEKIYAGARDDQQVVTQGCSRGVGAISDGMARRGHGVGTRALCGALARFHGDLDAGPQTTCRSTASSEIIRLPATPFLRSRSS